MNKKIFLKVKIFIIIITILIFIFYLYSLLLNYKTILKKEEEKVEIYTSLIASNLDMLLLDIKEDLEFINDSFIQNKNDKELENYFKKHKIVKGFFITDINKKIIKSSIKELENQYIPENLICVIFPFNNQIFKYIGVILNEEMWDIEDQHIENTINPFIYKKWNLLITDKNGYLIYHSNSMLKEFTSRNFKNHPSVAIALQGEWGLKRIKINNKSYYTYSQFLNSTDWIVILEISMDKIITELLLNMFPQYLFGLIIILLFIIGYFIITNILTRIENIALFINNYPFSKNNINEIETKKNDEISKLYFSFMNMIKKREEHESEILKAIEEERKRIGADLHDDLGQTLTGISFQLMLLENEFNLSNNKTFLEITDLLEKSILKTKTIAKGLSTLSLYENNIFIAIEDILKNIESIYNIKYSFNYDTDIKLKNEFLIINIYYILVEIINNIVKHSKANFILLEIEKKDNFLRIFIKDNGIGFNLDENFKGMGLKNIKYRAELIKADLKIRSNKDGTEFDFLINY
ncbi:MAG TPA: histidine kinase [Spirochaetota bacterium]|nr:histidine kinase [Spirochaetota bacterium]